MQRAVVTVKLYGEARVRDLEIPVDVEASELADLVARALHWETDVAGQPVRYEIEAEPPGRMLSPDELLCEAGVWDGSWLVFHRATGRQIPRMHGPIPRGAEAPPSAGPVSGWKPLLDHPSCPETPRAGESPPARGYVWKQID